jgi:outer membrane protein OmpA-like peptidoglycan-associated protein
MSTSDDDTQNFALAAVAALVALVVAGVIGLAVSTTSRPRAEAAEQAAAAERGEALGPAEHIYFEVASDALPPDAQELLLRLADLVRGNAGAMVLISGFHDSTGDPQRNAELAKNRALAVRHALEANGVDPQRLMLSKPQVTSGGADPRDARRVDIRVR